MEKFYLKALFDVMPCYAWMKDSDGRIIGVNKPLAEIYHKTPDEMIGLKDSEFVDESTARKHTLQDEEILTTGEPKFYTETITENGISKAVNVIKKPMFDDIGEIIGTVGIAYEKK